MTFGEPVYEVVDAAVVRAATRPGGSDVLRWPDLTDVPDVAEDPVTRWRLWLQEVWSSPVFAEALEVASPSLAHRVEEVCAGNRLDERQVRRAVLSVVRYLLRATGRATPFGLFAGIAPARLGSPLAGNIGDDHRPVARVETEWLAAVITRLESCRDLRHRLLVVRTNLAFVRDDRLVVGCQQQRSGSGDEPAEVSVRHTKPTQAILRATESPIRLGDLAAKLAIDFPDTPENLIDTMLAGLVAQRILITNLQPPMTVADPLAHVVEVLTAAGADTLPETAELAGALRGIHTALTQHDCARSAVRARGLRIAAAQEATAVTAIERPVSVDLVLGSDVSLPPAVACEAEAAAAALVKLTPQPFGSPAWQDYHGRFLERYGVGAVVPVEELLHGDTGLGFPAGYRDSRLKTAARPGLSDRDDALLALAQTAALRQEHEIQLDEKLITELAVADLGEIRVQPHTELRLRIHAATLQALDDGDFELALSGVSRAAGTTTGRFLDLFPQHDRDRMVTAYAALPTVNEKAIPVQVSGPTLYPRSDNVARTPAVLPHLLALGEHNFGRDGLIPVHDLAVVGDPHRLYLISLSRQVPVEPVLFSAVEFLNHIHPLVRFLCEISTARAAACAPFSWGAASRLPFLPRLRYRRTILSPARWLLAKSDLPEPDAPWKSWVDSLKAWQQRLRVPQTVYLGESDRRIRLDLTEPAHLHVLHAELKRAGHVAIREAPSDSAFGWIGGHAHEVVIPLATTSPPVPHRRWPDRVVSRDHGHLPAASPWLFAKLYGHPDRQNTVLTTHLPVLLSTWDDEPEWWFLRYHDPEHHLRLRFRLHDHADFGSAAARIATWSSDLRRRGLVGQVQFDTYYPETGRFGSSASMHAAEALFAADSASAVNQLAVTGRRDGQHLHPVIAASMVDLAISVTGDPAAGMRWLIDNATTSPAPAVDRTVHNAAIRLANPGDAWAALREIPGGESITAAWTRRRTALDAYRAALTAESDTTPETVLPDLLHLHHVRMVGIDTDAERACLRLARAAALSWTTRTRGAL
ncbi:lantibiotic dehydratase [Amycolatopsis sp. cmx-11-51]|uniref:lantibiotic dehydratase n=1 Tax=Amycolatopsis sp. cmx-11-51 TaxID=2785797 RepID=UPI0039E40D8E